jgi:hypothetical protein
MRYSIITSEKPRKVIKEHAFALEELWLVLAVICGMGLAFLVGYSIFEPHKASATPKPEKGAIKAPSEIQSKPTARIIAESSTATYMPRFWLFTDTKTGRQYLAVENFNEIIELNPQPAVEP